MLFRACLIGVLCSLTLWLVGRESLAWWVVAAPMLAPLATLLLGQILAGLFWDE